MNLKMCNPCTCKLQLDRMFRNVFKASLWRRLIGKALQAGRLGGRLASDWYGVRLTAMASGSRRFGVRFVEIEQGGRHTGMATVGNGGEN